MKIYNKYSINDKDYFHLQTKSFIKYKKNILI